MNKNLIKKYIAKLEKKDIVEYALKENISITENEMNLILELLKNDTDIILSNQFPEYIKEYKPFLSNELYHILLEKYDKYKGFIDL